MDHGPVTQFLFTPGSAARRPEARSAQQADTGQRRARPRQAGAGHRALPARCAPAVPTGGARSVAGVRTCHVRCAAFDRRAHRRRVRSGLDQLLVGQRRFLAARRHVRQIRRSASDRWSRSRPSSSAPSEFVACASRRACDFRIDELAADRVARIPPRLHRRGLTRGRFQESQLGVVRRPAGAG